MKHPWVYSALRFIRQPSLFVLALAAVIPWGCGYTTQTVLPREIKTLYVETVVNQIPLKEVYAYQPGVEIDVTNAIIRRVHVDGNLRVTTREEADAVLEAKLIRFEQEGLRFTSLERVEEFRLFVVLDMSLVDGQTGELIWSEPNFSGDAEYFVSDVRSVARQEATQRAIERLARNVVDRIVEDW